MSQRTNAQDNLSAAYSKIIWHGSLKDFVKWGNNTKISQILRDGQLCSSMELFWQGVINLKVKCFKFNHTKIASVLSALLLTM